MAQAVRPHRAATSVFTLRLGGVAALLTAVVLALGLMGLSTQPQGLGQRNWLIVLFQMNSGLGSLPSDPLRVLNPLDIAILVLVGLSFLGLWPVLGRRHRIWSGIAVGLPFVGIPLLLITGLTGRSAVMGGGLIIALLMVLLGGRFKLLGFMGLTANALLLAADFGTGVLPGPPVATAVGVGYVLLIGWYALLALNLMGQDRPAAMEVN